MPINNKISKDLVDLEPTVILEFYKLYYDTVNEPDSYFPFHPCSNGIENGIILNEILHVPVAVEVEEFETNVFNRINRPKIRISNEGYIISSILRKKNDFKFAKLERIKIFLKYIDDVNFEGGVNPYGISQPDSEISRDTFIISQKTQENINLVEFELTAPYDLENFSIPGRLMLGRYCYWQYRGLGCNYFGPPVCQDDDTNFSCMPTGSFNFQTTDNEWSYGKVYNIGDIVYLTTDKDPFRTWYVCQKYHIASENNLPSLDQSPWQKDGCAKTIPSCRKRFASTTIQYSGKSGQYINTDIVSTINNPVPSVLNAQPNGVFSLPFGGFPGIDRFQYGQSFKNRS